MGVKSAPTTRASKNHIGACTRGPASWSDLAVRVDRGRNLFIPPRVARLFSLPNGRVSMDGSSRRTEVGRIVRDFKLEPTAGEI